MNDYLTPDGVIHRGNVLEVLSTLPAESVHCVVTSPPYWGLRNYGVDGQLGLEATPGEYIAKMVEVFAEVRRVLRWDGTLWLNMGDSYAANRSYQVTDGKHVDVGNNHGAQVPHGLKPKDLVGMPWRLALALQADGWYLRSEITWCKSSPMPESVTGSHFTRHRVTMEEYEKLQGLRRVEGRISARTGYLQGLQGSEVSGGEREVPPKQEGARNNRGIRAECEGQGETSRLQPFGTGPIEQGQIRSNGERSSNPTKSDSEIQGVGPWQKEDAAARQSAEVQSGLAQEEARSGQEIPSIREGEGGRCEDTGQAACLDGIDARGSDTDGGGVVRDYAAEQVPLLLLQEEGETDNGSCNSSQQRRFAHEGECGPCLPELQFQEVKPASDALLDCPGCARCAPNNGYILTNGAGRPTSATEKIFLLTKSASYFYDDIAVRDGVHNLWNYWILGPEPFKGQHYASFPTEIPRRAILAGTSERGCCPECGALWKRAVEKEFIPQPDVSQQRGIKGAPGQKPMDESSGWNGVARGSNGVRTTGWQPTCKHDLQPVPCRVLDPFLGSGTTAAVARQLGRRWIGIELSPKYIELARRRIEGVSLPLEMASP